MKIAVLGGSFNPIHIGHLALADEVCVQLGYDKVLFIPTHTPPHKQMNDAPSAERRLQMVQAACKKDSRFVAEDCEIKRQGISYTFDTINYLQKKYQSKLTEKIGLIMGDDLLPGFHLWNHAKELSELCQIIIARRPSDKDNERMSRHANKAVGAYANTLAPEQFAPEDDPLFDHALQLENPMLSISSTDIRSRIAEGKAFKFLVPAQVYDFILRRNLYGYKQC